MTDSSPPEKKRRKILFNERFIACSTRRLMLWNKRLQCFFLACKGPSKDNVGVGSASVFQEKRPGAGFKTGDFGKKEKSRGLP